VSEYVIRQACNELPRLPLEGFLDLTYRCNNNCRHCWLWTPDTKAEESRELTFAEIMRIADEARSLGCRSWSISGGEPMLRPDFEEIFDYITQQGSYTLNTNGTLITPHIASLMKRKGTKMVALYGATADVHDHITRTPGSFDAFMRGCSLLREAGAGFIVQVIPMKDNFHQFGGMMNLAESLSPHSRIGSAWLYLSASGDPDKNREIAAQRLSPDEALEIDKPDICYEEATDRQPACSGCTTAPDDLLFASCISSRRDFHIDPYGQASFCAFIKERSLRYALRKGAFSEFWDGFIPSITNRVKGGEEYRSNCGSCELKKECRWCGVYGFLEHGRFPAKVEYLCHVARESRKFSEDWKQRHRRYFINAGITIQVDSDIPIHDITFDKAVSKFEVREPGKDIVTIRHHFSLPVLNYNELGEKVYSRLPWAIYKKEDSWIYLSTASPDEEGKPHQVAIFNKDHSKARIFNSDTTYFSLGGLNSLCLFPTDQIMIARILADRSGFYLHSAGVIFNGHGLLFVGHSEAGKSTTVRMLKERAEILCDDRNILKKENGQWTIHGTWSHGEIPDVSPGSAPLKAIFFLEKAPENRLVPIMDEKEAFAGLLACVIKPLVDAGWWEKTLSFIEDVSRNIPCFRLYFDKSGRMISLMEKLITEPQKDNKKA
jgi:MoaA/NifB/PqqE/SkfB family radical SAM enzyme